MNFRIRQNPDHQGNTFYRCHLMLGCLMAAITAGCGESTSTDSGSVPPTTPAPTVPFSAGPAGERAAPGAASSNAPTIVPPPKTPVETNLPPKPTSTGVKLVIDKLIADKRYADAVTFVQECNVDAEVDASLKTGDARYMAVYTDALNVPNGPIAHEQQAEYYYYILPATSDAIYDGNWQEAATKFAGRYNQALSKKLPSK